MPLNNPRQGDDTLYSLFRAALEQQRGSTSFAPAKRTIKVHSGRQARKSYNGQRTLQRVGGFASTTRAIYASPTIIDRFGEEVPRPMCVTVENRRGYTPDGTPFRNVGGSTSGQNYIGGRG